MNRIFLALSFLLIFCAKAFAQVEVSSISELKSAVEKANPGETIHLLAGHYQAKKCVLKLSGSKDAPIVIQAKKGSAVVFNSSVSIEGDYVQFSGIQFAEQGSLIIEGKACRVSNCLWDDSKAKKWLRVLPGSMEIEIDNNIFQNKIFSNTTFEKGCPLLQVAVRNQNEQHHIHHNLFKDVEKGMVGNGYETVQIITENNPFDPPAGHANTLIEENLFIRCNGEAEIISMKSNGNIMRRNTFRGCRGGLVLRHGDDNQVTQNYFFGDGESGSYGVRIQGTGQVVANNYFENMGSYGLGMMDGTPDDLYIRVEGAQIVFNTFINCNNPFNIGLNHSKHPNGSAPKDCKIIGNIYYSDKGDKDESFIAFVQDDQPISWQWKDNVAFGKKVPNVDGFIKSNPNLKKCKCGLMIPTEKTPVAKIKQDFSETLSYDLLGVKWTKKRSVGAIQFPVETNHNRILNEENLFE